MAHLPVGKPGNTVSLSSRRKSCVGTQSMGDQYNPHEILSKLRAKSGSSVGGSSFNVGPEPSRRPSISVVDDLKTSTRQSGSKNIRGPAALTLTPSQRQENLNARLELEKDIKRLQDEVSSLVNENLKLRQDKETIELQFAEYKARNDDVVTKLRAKIAALTIHLGDGLPGDRGVGAGRLYPPNLPSAKKKAFDPEKAHHSPNRTPGPELGGFRDPTFSELMRRSTPDHVEFKDALRRAGSAKLGPAAQMSTPSQNSSNQGVAHVHPPEHVFAQLQNASSSLNAARSRNNSATYSDAAGEAKYGGAGHYEGDFLLGSSGVASQPLQHRANDMDHFLNAAHHHPGPTANTNLTTPMQRHGSNAHAHNNLPFDLVDNPPVLTSLPHPSPPGMLVRHGSTSSINGYNDMNGHGGAGHHHHNNHHNHNGHHQPSQLPGHHNEYLSSADSSDGEDIPVLEINLE